jgi:hypothetical protein
MRISVVLLLASFVPSLGGLFVFIASMTRDLFGTAEEGWEELATSLVVTFMIRKNATPVPGDSGY